MVRTSHVVLFRTNLDLSLGNALQYYIVDITGSVLDFSQRKGSDPHDVTDDGFCLQDEAIFSKQFSFQFFRKNRVFDYNGPVLNGTNVHQRHSDSL